MLRTIFPSYVDRTLSTLVYPTKVRASMTKALASVGLIPLRKALAPPSWYISLPKLIQAPGPRRLGCACIRLLITSRGYTLVQARQPMLLLFGQERRAIRLAILQVPSKKIAKCKSKDAIKCNHDSTGSVCYTRHRSDK